MWILRPLQRFYNNSPLIAGFCGVIAILLIICGFAAQKPDYDVRFERVVPSKLAAGVLSQTLDDMSAWPYFMHSLQSAAVVDMRGQPFPLKDQKLAKGALILFSMVPPKKSWKRFDLMGEVIDYVPGKRIEIAFVRDSTDRVSRLFDSLVWKFEIQDPSETMLKKGYIAAVQGQAVGHTKNWRARMFGRISPRILMNQVMIADMVKLATLDKQIEAKRDNVEPIYQ